jgi:predicted transcriptional regulator
MPREKSSTLTDLQLAVMDVLWDRGSATVREVHGAVRYERELAYTTVSTVLTRLKADKMVTAKPGVKPTRFSAAGTREEATERSVDKVVDDWFGGSRTSLVAYMAQADGRSVSDLREARDLLEEAIRKADEG